MGEDIGKGRLPVTHENRVVQKLGESERTYRDYDTVLRAFRAFGWQPRFLIAPDDTF